jgi:hypothetical protein
MNESAQSPRAQNELSATHTAEAKNSGFCQQKQAGAQGRNRTTDTAVFSWEIPDVSLCGQRAAPALR